MNIESVNICLNCSNLRENFQCSLHDTSVNINNYCGDHNQLSSLTKDSSCLNCSRYQKSDCKYSSRSGEGMLCFEWKKK